DGKARRRKRGRVERCGAARIAERDDAGELSAVPGRGDLADRRAVQQDRLATPRPCLGIVERELHQALADAALALGDEGIAADEAGPGERDHRGEARLERRLVGRELGAPGPTAGLD